MGYELLGRLHAAVVEAGRDDRGQGTVEYVGLIMLMAVVLAAVVAAAKGWSGGDSLPGKIVEKLEKAIGDLGK